MLNAGLFPSRQERLDARHHPFTPTAAHIDAAVIGVAREAVAALL
jgi:hypothetical protein